MTDPTMLSPAEPKPDQVSDASVFDFHHYRDPGLLRDPQAPAVFWTHH
jgi:hypothetical protein